MIAILLDLVKAFGTVDRRVLLWHPRNDVGIFPKLKVVLGMPLAVKVLMSSV